MEKNEGKRMTWRVKEKEDKEVKGSGEVGGGGGRFTFDLKRLKVTLR